MGGALKFVAVILVLAALVSPTLALAVASGQSVKTEQSEMKCPPHCPMMVDCARAAEVARAAATNKEGSCCEMSSGKPAPAAVPQLPVNPVHAQPVAVTTVVHKLAATRPTAAVEAGAPTAPDTSPQALLCTFLI